MDRIEVDRIIHNSAKMPMYNGTTSASNVDKILDITGGQIFCNGSLRQFVFTPITANTFSFKTEDWYAKTYGS